MHLGKDKAFRLGAGSSGIKIHQYVQGDEYQGEMDGTLTASSIYVKYYNICSTFGKMHHTCMSLCVCVCTHSSEYMYFFQLEKTFYIEKTT